MKVLVVDDQTSVVNGIVSGVRFEELGIDTVLTANSAKEAREILEREEVQLLLCDIEMPEEDGLELNQWVSERYPEIVRIMLTSHADFSYAQKSIRLGCFEYIVQPAPYDEIEAAVARAVAKIETERQNKKIYGMGRIYMDYSGEMLDQIVLNLYSDNRARKLRAAGILNEAGYPLKIDSLIRVVLLDIYAYYSGEKPSFLASAIQKEIFNCLKAVKIDVPVYALLTLNRYKQFVVLLFCNNESLYQYDRESYRSFYQEMEKRLNTEISCYVSDYGILENIREKIAEIQKRIDDNVGRKKGLFIAGEEHSNVKTPNMEENLARWGYLLEKGQIEKMRANVLAYIDFIVSVNKVNFKSLCDLHQQLSYLMFNYAYNHEIDIMGLFTESYSYQDYMDSFKSTDSLKRSIEFVMNALEGAVREKLPQNEVQKAKTFIMNNISRNISVKDVADYVHLSPEYFTRLFKKETGQNIKNYIMQVKVDVAKDLLSNPGISVSLVALELGYNNFSHFTQMFKKIENVTPTEYRQRILGDGQQT